MSAHPERVVFIDETSVKTNLTRLRGWAPRGDRLVMDAPFGSWGTQTFIAGLTAEAMIAPWVIKGAMDIIRTDRPVLIVEFISHRLRACGVDVEEYRRLLQDLYWVYEICVPVAGAEMYSLEPFDWANDNDPAAGNLYLCPKHEQPAY